MLAALVVVAAGALYLFAASRSSIWDRDEAKFACSAMEMERSGNLLYPTFRGEIRTQKPILTYWLMAASFRLLGVSAWTARLWSPIAAAAACGLTLAAGRRLFSQRAGTWAAAALACSPLLIIEATAATADAVLLLASTAAMAAFAFSLRGGMTLPRTAAMTVSLAAALLAKGPVGAVTPVLGIVGTLGLTRSQALFTRRDFARLLIAALIAGAVFAAWLLPANRATGGRLVREGLGREVLARAVRPMEGHGGGPLGVLYYAPVVLVGFSPWTLYLPGAISAAAGGRLSGPKGRAFLASWSVPALLLFTLAATKLPHYILPIWPALALAVGAVIEAAREGRLSQGDRRWLARGAWLLAPLLAAECLLLFAGPGLLFPAPELIVPCAAAGAGLGLVGIIVLRRHLSGRFSSAALILAVSIPCLEAFGALAILPAFERFKAAPALAAAILRAAPAGASTRTYRWDSPSLDFALRSPVLPIPDPRSFELWRRSKQTSVLVTTAAALDSLAPPGKREGLREIARLRAYDYSKGRWMDVVAVGTNLRSEGRP